MRRLSLAMCIAAGSLVACSTKDILAVPDTDVATPAGLLDKASLPTVFAGAVGDVQVAFSGGGGGNDNFISMVGLFTDELQWAETFPTRQEVDSRSITAINTTMDPIFRQIHRARASAERAATGYAKLDPLNPTRAEALDLEAFTYILIGEAYCNGVPFGDVDAQGNFTNGLPVTNQVTFQAAVTRLDSAIAVATAIGATATTQLQLARVLKGRALLDVGGQFAAAQAAVTAVPTGFSYVIQQSDNTSRERNGINVLVFDQRRFTVSKLEGTNGLPFLTDSLDPRVLSGRGTGAAATGFDGVTQLFVEKKYPSHASNVVVGDGIEARLIEAEAQYQAGAFNTAGTGTLAILNTLRATLAAPFNAALADPGTNVGRENLIFKERAYWLWLTAHRLGDMRRLIRAPYGRGSETVFPTGAFFKGGVYGPDVNWPIPFSEGNNTVAFPSGTAVCIDRNA
jgi:hypothetical protein